MRVFKFLLAIDAECLCAALVLGVLSKMPVKDLPQLLFAHLQRRRHLRIGILRVDDLLLAVSLQIIPQVVGLLAYPWRAIQSYRFVSPLLCDYLCFSRVRRL